MKQIDAARVRALELASVMGNGRGFPLPYFAFLVGIAVLIRPSVSVNALSAWAGIYLVYIALRTKATSVYHADPLKDQGDHVRLWRLSVAGSAVVHGLILGSLAIFALPSMELPSQLALTAVVCLICAGGAVYVAALFAALFWLISFAIIPFALAWYWTASPMHALMPAMVFMAWALNVYLSWNHYRLLKRGWQVIVSNEFLSAELARKNAELEQAGSSRTRLFAIASHDLRQPVHALGLTIAQLNEYDHPHTLRRHFERLEESSFLVSEMLQELMDLSNLERNEYTLNVTPIRLDPLLKQTRLSQEVIARRKGLQLEIDVNTGIVVRSDPNLLRRILLNLVSNAVKYTVYGSVRVQAIVQDGEVCIRVSDTGIGIPQQQIGDIFRDYVRLEGASKTSQGIGLGLAIVKRAVDVLGHRLRVSSQIAMGSVFEVFIEASSEKYLPMPERVRGGTLAEEGARGELIVLIEDDPYALHSLADLVEKWGYKPLAASSVDEVWRSLPPGEQPALVIADLQLAVRDTGFEAIGAIRARFRGAILPAILLTGDVRPSVRARASRENITVANKPFSPMLLRDEIRMLIDIPATGDMSLKSEFESGTPQN